VRESKIIRKGPLLSRLARRFVEYRYCAHRRMPECEMHPELVELKLVYTGPCFYLDAKDFDEAVERIRHPR
jgi:hypothetical protein